MGTYATIKKLWELWKLEEVSVKQVIGQVLQYLVVWYEQFEALKLEVKKLKRQVEKLSSKG